MSESDPVALFSHYIKELDKRKIGFVEISIKRGEDKEDFYKIFRPLFKGHIIANNSFDFENGNQILKDGLADLVSFASLYISNPDLVYRFKNGWKTTPCDPSTFYSQGPEGYCDWKTYPEQQA
jgi:2,4-dienoyl-CoA reductase-like NADH-dependent reductase (Old Yellow Enzyme family)